MKKVLAFCTLALLSTVTKADEITLSEIENKSIYQSLSSKGFHSDQKFVVNYKKLTDELRRATSSSKLKPVYKNSLLPTKPTIGDVKTYIATGKDNGSIYQFDYEFTYMAIDRLPSWVFTKSTMTFLCLAS